jgi:hypothetical protein
MRTRLPVFVLIAVTLAAGGCGGSKGGSSTASSTTVSGAGTSASSQVSSTATGSGKPLSAAQLVAKADAICAQLNTELDRDHIRRQQDIARIVPHRVAAEQAALTALSILTPPASMAHDYRQMLATRRTLIEDTTKLGQAAAADGTNADTSLYASSTALVRQMATTAQRDGFKSCGKLG